MTVHQMRLTTMAHGGGCGCKLAPAVQPDILKKMPLPVACDDPRVGTMEAGEPVVSVS